MRKADEKGEGLSDAPLPHTMSLYNRAASFADVNLATLPCTSACRMFRASAFAIWWHACPLGTGMSLIRSGGHQSDVA